MILASATDAETVGGRDTVVNVGADDDNADGSGIEAVGSDRETSSN